MKRGGLFDLVNACLLLLCTSMYLGTGWSLILFSFPIAPQLTVDNYSLQFVPQVQAATRFFTWMTAVMLLSSGVLAWRERKTSLRWYPLGVLLAVVAATLLTRIYIFPYNDEMAAGITSPERLGEVLGAWMRMNRVRVGLWTVQWLLTLGYFVHRVLRAEQPAGARVRYGLAVPPRREAHA
ncbi:hypothetical protein JYK02_09695 [Corallococcus macrosporus]|uniref:DUF1772 domain-containing protein n=1 Tax=Corallococcus macrosporus TaxID=35 RepID=A0ABS3D7Z9_9BACT|nr:hypothetical protein [Corallococcus macrosporus]MBN8227782.1 hypothetical protein [Corallococcus macrosporus]